MFVEHHCVMPKHFLITLGTVAEVGTLVTLIPQPMDDSTCNTQTITDVVSGHLY